ncbi:C40 family peptidase [Nocardioides montaniterrae]
MRLLLLMTKTLTTAVLAASLVVAVPVLGACSASTPQGSITTISDAKGWVATFTQGSRTVTIRGTSRTFSEPNVTPTVTTNVDVRLLPAPFNGTVDQTWLAKEKVDTSPDLLDTAFQYVAGAAPITNSDGLQIAGDAAYGPVQSDGTRQEGSDFNDYLGLTWTYGATKDSPESDQFRSVDCSGFVRMVFGYRGGFPLSLSVDGTDLPRRAVEMASGGAPGNVIVANKGTQATTTGVRPGDLVFFDASTDDGTAIDHVGIYLGIDSAGRPRFISSRKTVNGPTISDVAGSSVLTGTGFYAKAYREARRL